MLLGGMILGLLAPDWIENTPETLLGIVFLGVFRIYEAAMFAAFGTTPMKALFLIRVRRADGGKLSFVEALVRSLRVWLTGEGLGIPLISLITQITAFNRVNRSGITSWDEKSGFIVTHQSVDWWRWLVWVGLFAGLVALIALGSAK
jgi:uncharacterized RDD family membrane protein YckC